MERVLARAMGGEPEFGHEEKNMYLGQFRERIIKALTIEQARDKGVHREIEDSLQRPGAEDVVINGRVGLDAVLKYERLAHKYGKRATTINDPGLKGNLGLVVVGREALDVEDIMVKNDSPVT